MGKTFIILLISTSLLILVGDNLLLSYSLAKVTGGLSANSVNKANTRPHVIGNSSNVTAGGLSANSVNKANTRPHVIGNNVTK
jgi:hypothetical protein